MKQWVVYMLLCADGSLYTGITTDIERRLDEHNNSPKGAKYTKSRRPTVLVYSERCKDRSEASTKEAQLKKLTKPQKEALIQRKQTLAQHV